MKKERFQKMSVGKIKPYDVGLFRKKWLKKGFELIDITPHCEFELGKSGWCNEFNEPDDNIYHVRAKYRGEIIANLGAKTFEVIDDDKYIIYIEEWAKDRDSDFVIFRLVPINKNN